jgi:UDP-N-acetyl-2-amino-2-deoxyglucuronate dehydrogenase
MLTWIFGPVISNTVNVHTHDRAAGYLELEKARVRWFLSISYDTIPDEIKAQGKRTYRSIQIGGDELEFSDGFTDLHTDSYKAILSGNGFRIGETKQAIQIVHDIRHATPIGLKGEYHPFAKIPASTHPFS